MISNQIKFPSHSKWIYRTTGTMDKFQFYFCFHWYCPVTVMAIFFSFMFSKVLWILEMFHSEMLVHVKNLWLKLFWKYGYFFPTIKGIMHYISSRQISLWLKWRSYQKWVRCEMYLHIVLIVILVLPLLMVCELQ